MRKTKTLRRPRLMGRTWLLAGLVLVGTTACDFLDPTEVENPQTTDDDLANAEQPTKALLPGLRAEFGRLMSTTVVTAEVVSDNYSIHGTGIQADYDIPADVTASLANGTGTGAGAVYWHSQELRALASFILDVIAPDDDTAEAGDIQEAQYFRGMALLSLGENFTGAPLEADGAVVPADQLLDRAITDLTAAVGGPMDVPAMAALARAYRWKGDATNATTWAQNALDAEPDFAYLREYDAATLTNTPWAFLVSRALQEMQPLPRLDFLDPKYLDRESGIPFAKAEEMYLIQAEAAMAGGDFDTGRSRLGDAIRTANARGTTAFTDADPRNSFDLSIRPRDAMIEIRADASSPFRSGLVLTRPDMEIPVPTISATSLDADSIEAIATSATEDLWHALHLARQEILFLEGRRMADLGIRLPIMLREIDQNPNLTTMDPATQVTVPSYIPSGVEMDLYTPFTPYDETETLVETQITINVDMNRVLAQNLVTPFGS